MMPVTHGIVSIGETLPDTFSIVATSVNVGDSLSYYVYADIGDVVRTDYGDGIEVLTTITANPENIIGNTVSTVNMIVKSTGLVTRVIFDFATDNYDTINLAQSSTITDASLMCKNLTNLTSFLMNDSSQIVDLQGAWNNCSSLTSFPAIDTSSVTSFAGTWQSCSGLTSFPLLDTSAGVIFNSAWRGCPGLTSFPPIDTSLGNYFANIFLSCTNLVCISSINTLLQIDTADMFTGTPALTNPNATEQTAILAGSNYINAGACP